MVLYLSAYLNPRDPRWHPGIQSTTLRLLPLKNLLYMAIFILYMIEIASYNRAVKRAGGFGHANDAWGLYVS